MAPRIDDAPSAEAAGVGLVDWVVVRVLIRLAGLGDVGVDIEELCGGGVVVAVECVARFGAVVAIPEMVGWPR